MVVSGLVSIFSRTDYRLPSSICPNSVGDSVALNVLSDAYFGVTVSYVFHTAIKLMSLIVVV